MWVQSRMCNVLAARCRHVYARRGCEEPSLAILASVESFTRHPSAPLGGLSTHQQPASQPASCPRALVCAITLLQCPCPQVLIGIVSEEIKLQLKGVRSGNYPVVTADHTLVLNWNRQSTSLLRKMVQDSHGCSKSLGRSVGKEAGEQPDAMNHG